ncbi:MAG: replication-relaxation family protein [Alphaproteobacteria bacterium]|nr:replication-relaxation family protein [Alphaproteobacteria bacterium]MCW5741621.1 replication-relaxation family protein [Alphaproteobacteria bacterium]
MDAPTKKNSRWSRTPKRNAHKLRETPRLLEILKLLHRRRYAPSNDIHAWVGGHKDSVRKLLDDMWDEPNCLINRPMQQRQNADANYTHMIYELDRAGADLLRVKGLPKYEKTHHANFEHEVLVNRIMHSIELGVRERPDVKLITWPEIMASGPFPQSTLESPVPMQLPYRLTVRDGKDLKTQDLMLSADGEPFGLKTPEGYFFAPGYEADCATEPLNPEDYRRSSIRKKIMGYRYVIENSVYQARWGLPTLYVPFFFPTISRMESAMRLLTEETKDKPALRRFFLFKVFPTLTTYGGQAPATGHVFTEPFQRAGMAPFYLGGAKEAANGHRETESAHRQAGGD